MSGLRSYSPKLNPSSPTILLSPEESHHLIAVHRAQAGDEVSVIDGFGSEWRARIETANKRGTILEGTQHIEHSPPATRIALAQSIPKAKGMESIIRKATELGIQDIYPILSARTESKVRGSRKLDKWQTIAIEATKQSGNPFIPTIHPETQLGRFLESGTSEFGICLIASLQMDSQPLYSRLAGIDLTKNPSALFLIGPEGDFSDSEYSKISDAGFLSITLGKYVLKCETAAIKAISLLQYEFAKMAC